MNCKDRDPDLLMYGLGELPLWQQGKVALHLSSCARCRDRQKELTAVSGRIAGALTPSAGGPARLRTGPRITSGLIWWTTLTTLAVLMITLITFQQLRHRPVVHPTNQEEGCRPGLPNDRCR